MAELVLVLGDTGSGKTLSTRNLPPEETFMVTAAKGLLFKGSKKLYTQVGPDNPTGNLLRTKKTSEAVKYLKWVKKNRPNLKYVIIDDNQYLSMFTYVNRAYERDYYSKFTDIGVAMVQFVQFLASFPDDVIVFILHHIETGTSAMGNEQIQAKTVGRFVKEKITYEGLFNIVLLADKEPDDDKVHHFFWTRLAGSVVKTPLEMFEDQKIPNDLKLVADAIREFE